MIRKVVLGLLVVFILLAGGIVAYIYFNKDKLKDKLITTINERLIVPVDVEDVYISPLSSFPNATVTFYKVKIADPYNRKLLFASANSISFSFNIWELIKGEMVLEQIDFQEGLVNIVQYTDTDWSYQIYREAESQSDEQFILDIKEIHINDLTTSYSSHISNTAWNGVISSAEANIKIQGPVTWITMASNISSHKLKVNEYLLLQDQEIVYNGEMVLDKHWRINSSILKIGPSVFELNVEKNDENINATLIAENADIKTLLNIAPAQVNKRLKAYSSNGKISFNTGIKYNLNSGQTALSSDVLFNNVDIDQRDGIIHFKNLNLTAKVDIPDFNKLSSASFKLSGIKGQLNDQDLTAELQLTDFDNPFMNGLFKGELPLSFIKDLGGYNILKPSGSIYVNVAFKGLYSNLTKSPELMKTSGEIGIDNLNFYLPNKSYAIQVPEGNIIFNNDHLAINDLALIMGSSTFLVNGQLRNFWNITSDDKWSATADVYSKSLQLDELLSVENPNPKADHYTFSIPDNITLDLKATVDDLKVRKFSAKNATGNIVVKNKKLLADKVSLTAMGGLIKLKGEWVDMKSLGSNINISCLFAGIDADSLFYSFENFNQEFITDKNLSGKIYAEAQTSIKLDSNLIVIPSSLNATLKTRIVNGQLKDFAPLYGLEKYLDNADLSKVQFAELENEIVVRNSIIQLPMMAVGTNIIKFKIGGLHSFDQYIDYDVVAPLIRKKRKDSDEAYGQVAEDQHGESLVFLSIKGKTDNYEISINKQAIKNEIASDVKREAKELQDAFKNNGKTTKAEVELEEDDYFDWDDNDK